MRLDRSCSEPLRAEVPQPNDAPTPIVPDAPVTPIDPEPPTPAAPEEPATVPAPPVEPASPVGPQQPEVEPPADRIPAAASRPTPVDRRRPFLVAPPPAPDGARVKARLLACACALAVLALPAAALAASGGTPAGLRAAVTRLVDAELARDGATACGILYAPLTATVDGRSCAQRWDTRIARLLARHGGAGALRADLRAIPAAGVSISGLYATIALPHALFDGQSRFYWTANCWMLTK